MKVAATSTAPPTYAAAVGAMRGSSLRVWATLLLVEVTDGRREHNVEGVGVQGVASNLPDGGVAGGVSE